MELPRNVDLDASDLPVGFILRRWYKGEEHVVRIIRPLRVTEASARRGWWRYHYRGRRWKTLSAIAFEITGFRQKSGNEFFGLRLRRRGCGVQLRQ